MIHTHLKDPFTQETKRYWRRDCSGKLRMVTPLIQSPSYLSYSPLPPLLPLLPPPFSSSSSLSHFEIQISTTSKFCQRLDLAILLVATPKITSLTFAVSLQQKTKGGDGGVRQRGIEGRGGGGGGERGWEGQLNIRYFLINSSVQTTICKCRQP